MRTRSATAPLVAVVVAVAVAAGCSSPDGAGEPASEPTVATTVETTDAVPGEPEGDAWTPRDVVDGDTIVVERSGREARVRIIGINTPESGECLADAAADRLEALVADQTLRLVRDTSDTDQFGRLLRYVETADGTDVGAALVADGLAIARRYEPDTARATTYERLQADARATGIGLWAPDSCGRPSVAPGAISITVNANPPGDDTDDLTGEWVEFTNDSGAAIDLDGFTVADESASNRYEFDDVDLASGATVRLVTGCGTDTGTDGTAVVHWCTGGSAVWNNGGDTVFLRDRTGNLVASLTYDGS
jgi:micrococcal nuclease